MALTGNSAKLLNKTGQTFQEINPKTVATQVWIPDEAGGDSNVETAIQALRKKIGELQGMGAAFKGVLTSKEPLPTVAYKAGWMYLVKETGTYAGERCEVGDFVICVKDYASGSASNADWAVVQKNITGAVTGPATAVANRVATFADTSGTLLKDSGFTIAKSVPADAVFTDTTYNAATQSADGLMASADKKKLDGIEASADKTDAQNVASAGAFMKATDTAESIQDGASKVLMTTAERTKLTDIASGAEVNQNAVSNVKVGTTVITASAKQDTIELAEGSGIALAASGKKVTITEKYIDSCVVTSLDNVPANLRDGGIVILKQ